MTETLQSEKTSELVAALIQASARMRPAKKDSENPFFHSKYADLTSITESSREALVANNLVVVQSTAVDAGQCVLVTTVHHSSGQWVRGFYPVTAIKSDPQSMGSAVTYARRYALSAILGIVTEDDDGESAMGRRLSPTRIVQAVVHPPVRPEPVAVEPDKDLQEDFMRNVRREAHPEPADKHAPISDMVLNFGKYKGQLIRQIALEEDGLRYLEWLERQELKLGRDGQPFKNDVQRNKLIRELLARAPESVKEDAVPF